MYGGMVGYSGELKKKGPLCRRERGKGNSRSEGEGEE